MPSFATTEELGQFLGGPLTGDRLTQATLALEIASAQIQGWTRQRLERVVDDVLVLPGTTDWELELPERPVVSIDGITIDGIAVGPDSYRLAGATLVRVGGWSGSTAIVELTYTHGFDPIPDDIRGVTLALAARIMSNPIGIRQEGVGTYQVTYGGDDPAVGGDALLAPLSRYRRRTASPRLKPEYPYRTFPVANG